MHDTMQHIVVGMQSMVVVVAPAIAAAVVVVVVVVDDGDVLTITRHSSVSIFTGLYSSKYTQVRTFPTGGTRGVSST